MRAGMGNVRSQATPWRVGDAFGSGVVTFAGPFNLDIRAAYL